MRRLSCVFCGARLEAGRCVWVRLPDGADFVCCPSACPPMVEAIEDCRREMEVGRHQIALPLGAA
jgi:hypothetical protein